MIGLHAPGVKQTPHQIGCAFAAIPLDVLSRPDLTPAAKLVFAAVANFARMGRGTATTASNGRIAAAVGLTASGVRRPLDELDKAGLIARDHAAGGRVRLRIRITYSPAEVVEPATTQETALAPERQPGCRQSANPLGAGAATFKNPSEERPKTVGTLDSKEEKTGSSPPLTAADIARAIADGIAGQYAPMIFDAEPTSTTSPASEPTPKADAPIKPTAAKPATAAREPRAEPFGGLPLGRVGVSAVAAAFSPAFGAVRNTPEAVQYQAANWRKLRANLPPAPPLGDPPPRGERPAILPNPTSRGALANPGKL